MKNVPFVTVVILICILSCNTVPKKSDALAEDSFKYNLSIYIDSCWNGKNLGLLTQIVSDDFVRSLNGINVVKGANELEAHINTYIKAFPNLQITASESFMQENTIITTWTFTGTNTGEFTEFDATGKKTKVSGVSIIEFNDDGKMSREETYYNELYLLQQLGYGLEPPNME
jgi:steroid delta-isomerase-like uncharacterized protein